MSENARVAVEKYPISVVGRKSRTESGEKKKKVGINFHLVRDTYGLPSMKP